MLFKKSVTERKFNQKMTFLLLAVIFLGYISLGIPDSLIGAAWPAIYKEFSVPISGLSVLTSIIYIGTIIASFSSARVIKKLGTGKTAAFSTALTALALFGFSVSKSVWLLCLCCVPLGLGAGSIDTALNNYVATNFKARQMNFLHCFYGVGVSLSPYIMSLALSDSGNWRGGYKTAFILQAAISAVLFLALPLWKRSKAKFDEGESKILKLSKIVKIPKARAIISAFFWLSTLESVCLCWGSSFLVSARSLTADRAAAFFALYFAGMTAGRFLSGVLSKKLSPMKLVITGQAFIFCAVILLLVPNLYTSVAGLVLAGFGIGPIFPNLTQITPPLFGKDVSQSVIGTQMGFAYISVLLSPVITGFLVERISALVFPFVLAFGFVLLTASVVFIVKCAKNDGQNVFDFR